MDELATWQEQAHLDIASGPNPDLAHQWDTKRKLFILAEVCIVRIAVLIVSCFYLSDSLLDPNLAFVWSDLIISSPFLSLKQYVSQAIIGAPYSVTAELLDYFKVHVTQVFKQVCG